MKKHTRLFSLLFCILFYQESNAQFNLFAPKGNKKHSSAGYKSQRFAPYSEISLGGGSTNYYGELALYHAGFFPAISNIRWNATVGYQKHISPRFGFRLGLSWVRVFGDDFAFANATSNDLQLFARGLHFRNDIKEFSAMGVYNLTAENKNSYQRAKVVPYIFGGLAVFAHNPEAKSPTEFGNNWESLQPLHTEGQGLAGYGTQPYSLVQVAIPMGLGVRLKVGRRFDVSLEGNYRYTFTDYLDDVSGNYALTSDLESDLAKAMAARFREPVNAYNGESREPGIRAFIMQEYGTNGGTNPFQSLNESSFGQRGATKTLDSYFTTTLRIHYILQSKIKCPVIR